MAAYEKLSHELSATPELLAQAFFAEKARAHALMLEVAGSRVAGFATWFYTFSTFVGRPNIYIEDIYVEPQYRKRGLGRHVFKHLARRAIVEECGRLEWRVLAWNTRALEFYRLMGASDMDAWRMQRLTGPALVRLSE